MKVKIDVFSDAICPWCYVGKKRLERAMEEMSSVHEFEVAWHPFQLNPNTPADGLPRQEYLSRKFGSLKQLSLMDARMRDIGREEGIEFNQDKIARTPNTLNAHRLVWFAGKEGGQSEVVENLFRAYFVQGRDIGDVSVLVQVAGESGLDPARAEDFLKSDEGRAEVRVEENQVKDAGIRAVPLFIINGESALEGAVPPESFIQAVESLKPAKNSAAV